jgi:subtilase family serine protease
LAGMTAMASLAAVPLTGITAGAAAAAPATHLTSRAVPASKMGGEPLYKKTTGPNQAGLFSCQAPQSATNPVPCYAPQQIRTAYNVPSNLTGAGETIVIIDAFGNPYIQGDLATFDSTFGLPPANLNIICLGPGGTCPTYTGTPDQVGWGAEIALDTQWAHAIAPGATIDLVIANSDQDPDILAAQQYVVNHNLGDVLSQSFGEWETCLQEEPAIFAATLAVFEKAQQENMSVFASAGDAGSAQYNCPGTAFVKGVSMPASDPLVTSVGATHLNANYNTGAYRSETVWNNSGQSPDFGAGGGGFSTIYARPSYQNSAHTGSAYRGVPDVTYTGDVYNGVLVTCSACGYGPGAFFIVGGTSVGSPNWAAITALADQAAGHRLGFLNPTLYSIANSPYYPFALRDILIGNNAWDVAGVTGYSAHPGWDAASGLGSPQVTFLIKVLTGFRY